MFQFLIGSLEAVDVEHSQTKKAVFQFLIGSLEARVTVNSKPKNFVVNGITCHAKHMKLMQRNDGWKYTATQRA